MDQVIAALIALGQAVLDGIRGIAGAGIALFKVPADWVGMPPEILAMGLFALFLVLGWRSLGGMR